MEENTDRARENEYRTKHSSETERKSQSQGREIIIWISGLYIVEFIERSTYVWKSIKKKSYMQLILIKQMKRAKMKNYVKRNHNKDC